MAPDGMCAISLRSCVRILFISNVTPWPAHGGVHLRILHLIERVARHHTVSLGCHVWSDEDRDGVAELNRRGIPTVGGLVHAGSWERHARAGFRRARRGIPPETAPFQAKVIHELIRTGAYDVLHIEESLLAAYSESIPPGRGIRRVITLHNVHFIQEWRIAAFDGPLLQRAWTYFNAAWMWFYEPRLTRKFDRVIAVSDTDRDALLRRAPNARVDVIPNGVDTRALALLPPPSGKLALLFLGSMFYPPCVDGAVWLVREILPLLRRTHPELDVWIVGKHPVADVRALAGDGVFVTGEVDDVRPYYERATLAVVPLRAGGGSRLKILEAMALGRCVVSTTVGAEGLRVYRAARTWRWPMVRRISRRLSRYSSPMQLGVRRWCGRRGSASRPRMTGMTSPRGSWRSTNNSGRQDFDSGSVIQHALGSTVRSFAPILPE